MEAVEFFKKCVAHAQRTQQHMGQRLRVLLENGFVVQVIGALRAWVTMLTMTAADEQRSFSGAFHSVLNQIADVAIVSTANGSRHGLVAFVAWRRQEADVVVGHPPATLIDAIKYGGLGSDA